MRIVCVGGGPAALSFAVLARLRSGGRDEVTVLERGSPGTVPGFAVTLGEDILDALYRADPAGAPAIRAAARVWGEQVVEIDGSTAGGTLDGAGGADGGPVDRAGGAAGEVGRGVDVADSAATPPRRTVHLGGRYGYAIGRARLVELLTDRARALGVTVRYGVEVGVGRAAAGGSDPDQAPERGGDPARDPLLADADLVLAADGAGSPLRTRYAADFGTTVTEGVNRYAWFGTTRAFDAFTFAYRRTPAGWVWFHAYPAADCPSTCIVECAPATWTGLGLDRMSPAEAMALLAEVFSGPLHGHRLLAPPGVDGSPWRRFREVRNTSWVRGNVVLVGDAAHTTHFAIGSGTVLAVADAIALSDAVHGAHGDLPEAERLAQLPSALAAYDRRRRAELAPVQAMATRSAAWFEDVATLDARLADPVGFAWTLLDRRGDQGPLHERLHRATQLAPVRALRRRLTTARRWRRAARRGERAL